MDNGKTHDFFTPGNRRSGIDRREFSYSCYVPERRLGRDRRRLVVDDPEAFGKTGEATEKSPGKPGVS
jgi:hypothetical protein